MIPGKEHKKEKFSKIAYKRNTGVADSDGLPYTNTEDVSLLAKLGYSVDEDYYLFLPRGEDREDLYSYVEKVAGVSKDVAKCIDQGTAFSGEHLKDMGYEVPEGYKVKGDLVCPVEKKAAADPAQTILITGHSGSGKSTLGKLLAEKLNLPLHRVDAQQSWDDLRANLEAAPDHERKALTPGTLENKKYIRDIRKIVRKSLGEIDGPAILEGTQVTTLPDKQLKKYMANILVGGDVNQSIAQRLERMSDKAAKKGINFSPEQIEKKKLESKLVAESWSPGMDKFRQMPGVLKYNHTEHKPEALIDQLRVLMNKKAGLLPEHIIAGTAAGLSLYAIHKQNQKNKKEKKVKPAGIVPVKTAEATHKLKSSNIRAVGYDKENKKLEVAFHSGGNYTYNDVPKSLFDRIKRVKSPGKFFHKHIKRDNPYKYERIEKESEYKLHWSKDVHDRITAGRPYPFSYLTGEAKELVDAIKNRDWDNFKEEIGDTTYAAQMLAAQATGLNHPMLADISKFEHREKNWKDMFKDKGGVYHPDHMRGGSNYAKPSKIIKAFASAGIKVDQREAERLANKYTGGKMEKEAGAKIIPAHIRDLMIRRSQGDKSALEALRNIGRANAAKRARLKPIKDLINRTSEPAAVQPKPMTPAIPVEQPVRLDPETIKARFDEIRRSLGNPGQTKQAYTNKLLKEATTFGATRNLLRQMQSQGVKLSRTPKQYVKMINPGSPALLDKAEAQAARTGLYNAKNKVIHVNRNLAPYKSPRNILFHEAGHATHRIEDPILRGKNKYTPENTLARERIANNNAINFMRQNNVPNENVQNYIKQMNNSYKTYLINPRLPFGKAIKNNQKVPQKLQLPPSYSVQIQ